MKLIDYLQSKPTLLLAVVITAVSICIMVMIIIMLFKLETERRVTKAALELKKITNSIHAGLVHFLLEDQCRILYASKGFFDLLGYKKEEAKRENKFSVLDFVDLRDRNFFTDLGGQLQKDMISHELRMITRDGSILHVLMNGNSAVSKDGRHTISVVFVDISEQKKMHELMLLEGERYRIATELSKDVLFEYHFDSDEMIYTDKFRDAFGREPKEPAFGKNYAQNRSFIYSDDWGIYLEFCQEIMIGKNNIEAQFRLKDRMGEFIWCQVMGKTIYDDDKKPVRIIGKIVNIDIQKRELEALEYKATRDPLTGVYNKEITIKKIEKYISGNHTGKHMLMLIDFDDFKKINDTYGHLIGDKVLTYVIERIKDVFFEGEIIGRIGGDEFVVFCGNFLSMEDVLDKAQIVMKTLNTTYEDRGKNIPISGSIGISLYPEDGVHYEQLMERADKALYKVKEQGKNNYMVYTPLI